MGHLRRKRNLDNAGDQKPGAEAKLLFDANLEKVLVEMLA
jgi:hypothetical protein